MTQLNMKQQAQFSNTFLKHLPYYYNCISYRGSPLHMCVNCRPDKRWRYFGIFLGIQFSSPQHVLDSLSNFVGIKASISLENHLEMLFDLVRPSTLKYTYFGILS